jgi:hypothetical protein
MWQSNDRDRTERDRMERDRASSTTSDRLPAGSQMEAWTKSQTHATGQSPNAQWNSNPNANSNADRSTINASANFDRSNMNASNARNWADGTGDRGYNDRLSQSNWSNSGWNDREVRMIQDRELPDAVRSGFVRDSNGSTLSETGKGMWRGSEAYSTRVVRNGQNYRMISDSSGNIIAMYRID